MTMNFTFQNQTRIVFGEGEITQLATLVPSDAIVMLLFGGGSIQKNGVHAAVTKALGERKVVAFGGVEPNPDYATILAAAKLARDQNVTFILGVGGGSVIDAAKFLAAVVVMDETDPWDALLAETTVPAPLANGAVLTLPATGSESNPVSVISNSALGLKLPFAIESARPQFAILDPTTMASLPRRQLQNGVVDAMTHVLEQYLTLPVNAPVQYGFSETLLEVLISWGPILFETDEARQAEARENIMWVANLALNGLIGSGVAQDWSTHMIGHALTALYGIDHAQSLTLVMPHLLRRRLVDKQTMLARFGRRVWHLEGDEKDVALGAILRTEAFFQDMECPIQFSDMPEISLDVEAVIRHLEEADQFPLGEDGKIDAALVRIILNDASQ